MVDCEERLRSTLCHEMCHAAAWLINHSIKPPHGPVFKAYAARAMRAFPELDISTCHSYAIDYKFRWKCASCGHIYGRHSQSIKPSKQRCGQCMGMLVQLPRLKADGTPARARAPSAFALFVKENYRGVQQQCPALPQAAIMKILSKKFQAAKQV